MTSKRTLVDEATGGDTAIVGEALPIVDATTTSSAPLPPDAITDPAALMMAERMPVAAGCATLTVVTLNTSTCKRDIGLSKKEPENATLKTGAP